MAEGRRELRLGQQLYFVLWDEDSGEAGVARGEVVQYASDYSKVRVKVVDAPQRTVIGRSTWVLPERLDDDPRSARRSYQIRAREQLRAEEATQAAGGATSGNSVEAGEGEAVAPQTAAGASEQAQSAWRSVVEGWRDIDLLVETVDFESGWPDHQARLAKFAVLAVLALRPAVESLLAALPAGDEAESVRAALDAGALGTAARLCAGEPARLLTAWAEVPPAEVAAASDDVAGLRSALAELGERFALAPALAAPAATA